VCELCSMLVCVQCWLDHEKPISKQVPSNEAHFRFLVKFYTPDPVLLEDEFTRSACLSACSDFFSWNYLFAVHL